jgi:hypothetical protein
MDSYPCHSILQRYRYLPSLASPQSLKSLLMCNAWRVRIQKHVVTCVLISSMWPNLSGQQNFALNCITFLKSDTFYELHVVIFTHINYTIYQNRVSSNLWRSQVVHCYKFPNTDPQRPFLISPPGAKCDLQGWSLSLRGGVKTLCLPLRSSKEKWTKGWLFNLRGQLHPRKRGHCRSPGVKFSQGVYLVP